MQTEAGGVEELVAALAEGRPMAAHGFRTFLKHWTPVQRGQPTASFARKGELLELSVEHALLAIPI